GSWRSRRTAGPGHRTCLVRSVAGAFAKESCRGPPLPPPLRTRPPCCPGAETTRPAVAVYRRESGGRLRATGGGPAGLPPGDGAAPRALPGRLAALCPSPLARPLPAWPDVARPVLRPRRQEVGWQTKAAG